MVPQDESTSMEQRGFGSINPAWNNTSMGAFTAPVPLGTVPPSATSDIGFVPGSVSQTFLGRIPIVNRGSLPTIDGDSEVVLGGRSKTVGIQAMQTPVDRAMSNAERRDGRANLSPERYLASQPDFACCVFLTVHVEGMRVSR